jgi:hypothetical protein
LRKSRRKRLFLKLAHNDHKTEILDNIRPPLWIAAMGCELQFIQYLRAKLLSNE